MAKKYVKRCSKSPIIRKVEIKTTLRCHLKLVRIVFMKEKITSPGKDIQKREPLNRLHAATVGNSVKVPKEIKDTNQQFLLWLYTQRK